MQLGQPLLHSDEGIGGHAHPVGVARADGVPVEAPQPEGRVGVAHLAHDARDRLPEGRAIGGHRHLRATHAQRAQQVERFPDAVEVGRVGDEHLPAAVEPQPYLSVALLAVTAGTAITGEGGIAGGRPDQLARPYAGIVVGEADRRAKLQFQFRLLPPQQRPKVVQCPRPIVAKGRAIARQHDDNLVGSCEGSAYE